MRRWSRPGTVLSSCFVALLIGSAACDGEAAEPGRQALNRRGRFGSIRDFVLIHRAPDAPGAALFVDRFEATQDDWDQFAASPAGREPRDPLAATEEGRKRTVADGVTRAGPGALPVAGMDLMQARAFAHWRMGRLPTEDEWRRVTAGGGNSPFPWGVKQFATHANTGDIGLGEAVPVGTFESGRRAGGNMPYDLIGNVREWTETVPAEWLAPRGPLGSQSFASVRREALRAPALAVWGVYGLLPLGAIASAGGLDVPHKVVGSDFATPMRAVVEHQHDTQIAGSRSQRTGLRVYATVDELLARLLAMTASPTADERLQLVRFVRRDGHRPVLKAAFEASPVADMLFVPGSIGGLVAAELRALTPEPK